MSDTNLAVLAVAIAASLGCSLSNAPASIDRSEGNGGAGGGVSVAGALADASFGGAAGAAMQPVENTPNCDRFISGDAGDAARAGIVFCDDFELGAGQWDLTTRIWLLTEDGSLVYTSGEDLDDPGESRTTAGDSNWTDVTIRGRVKVRSMVGGRRIYLAGRYQDSDNWYGAALYNSKSRRVQIRRKVAGNSSDIPGATANFAFEDDRWYEIQFQLAGSRLSMAVDGEELVSGVDETFTSGRIALLADRSAVSWDDIVVSTP